jgi:chromate transporter
MESKADLKDIAKLFLKLGIIGFGGPAAHIAMMQDEVVTKKKWLTEQHFLANFQKKIKKFSTPNFT